jgi:hypothetical protein
MKGMKGMGTDLKKPIPKVLIYLDDPICLWFAWFISPISPVSLLNPALPVFIGVALPALDLAFSPGRSACTKLVEVEFQIPGFYPV